MYFKKLSIQGFKSFASKTELEFGERITAIVGPNGSGKSNISDAIRWVLGEQSAKELRGGKMEDVIFAGTQKLKPHGYAEVSIILDNSDGLFPIDFEEIEITRRAFRSGESEFFINKAPCRLKDIHELFMDTGLGRDGYSVIGQGKIDTILSTRSEDRREVFEEAAGISKYKYRREEAERKLAKAEENLERTLDIISELESRLGPLSESAEKAKRFLSLRDRLRELDVNLTLGTIEKREAELEKLKALLNDTEGRLAEANTEYEYAEARLAQIYESAKVEEAEIEEEREKLHELELRRTQAESELNFIRENIQSSNEEKGRLTALLTERAEKEGELLGRLENEKAQKKKVLDKLREAQERAESLENEAKEYFEKTKAQSDEIEGLRQLAETLNREAAELNHKIESINNTENDFESRSAELKNQLQNAREKESEFAANIEELKNTRAQKENEVNTADERLKGALKKRAEKQAECEALKEEFNALVSRLGNTESRLKLLSEMEAGFEGYHDSVKALASGAQGAPKIRGVISKLISVPEEYSTAIDIALGAGAQNIVVETEKEAKAAIEYLKERKLGRATFLPLSSIKPTKLTENVKGHEGVIGIASELVEYPPDISAAVEYLLGRTVVVDTFDNATALSRGFNARLRIVTLKGEIINPGGAITGGSVSFASRLVGRAAEIKSLEKECQKLSKAVDKADLKVLDALDEIEKLSGEIEAWSEAKAKAEADIIRLGGEIELNSRLKGEAEAAALRIEAELNELISRSKNADKERERAKELLLQNKERLARAEESLKAGQAALREMFSERERHSSQLLSAKTDMGLIAREAELCDERISEAEQKILEYREETAKTERRLMEESKKIEEALRLVEAKENEIKERCAEIEKANEKLLKMRELRAGADSEAAALREKTKETQQRILRESEEKTRLTSRIERAQNEIDSSLTRLWEEYELTLTAAREMKKDIGPVTAATRAIAQLKAEIKGLGSVNIDAINEYAEVKERYDFLSAQAEDLQKAKKDLTKIIEDLTQIIKEQFERQFEEINQNFKEMFTELFGGGRAELRLSAPDNVLESDIEIVAEPPGKKLQSISLLSGGEKAFTAIALLFAILKTRPTPFCVFDEIEATLDESNVYRFAEYLKSYPSKTQFILITHRRGTMEAADILYGVTMQEKGVSRLLSMRLDEVGA